MPSESTKLSYLPTAHTSRGRTNDYDTPASDSAAVISTQPAPAASMNTNGSKDDQNRAMRLRGGCIPCPVSTKRSLSIETESLTKFQDGGCCYIIPIPCCCWGDFHHPTHPLTQQSTMLYPIHSNIHWHFSESSACPLGDTFKHSCCLMSCFIS